MKATLVPFDDANGGGLTPLRSARALRALQRAELEVCLHGLKVDTAIAKDDQFVAGITDVVTEAAREEIGFLKTGMALAGNSAAGLEVVAQLASLQQTVINRRIARTWGR